MTRTNKWTRKRDKLFNLSFAMMFLFLLVSSISACDEPCKPCLCSSGGCEGTDYCCEKMAYAWMCIEEENCFSTEGKCIDNCPD